MKSTDLDTAHQRIYSRILAMALKIVRRYDANGNVIEDKDLERFRLDSPVVRQILYQMNKEMGAVDNIKIEASEKRNFA